MKPVLLHRALLAPSLLLASSVLLASAHAADKAAKPAAHEVPLGIQAFTAAVHEMQVAMEDGVSVNKNFEKLVNFQHSADTVKLLVEAFGNERPWSMEKRGQEQGKTAWQWKLAPLHQRTRDGGTLIWSELPVDMLVNQAGTAVDFRSTWPLISYEDTNARVTWREGSFSGTQQRSGGIWYGSMQGGFDSIQADGKAQPFSMSMRGIGFGGKVTERPRTVDMHYSFAIKAIEVAGQQVDDFTLVTRAVNIEKAALLAMQAAQKKMSAKEASSVDDMRKMMPMFKTMLRGAMTHKTALLIDEMSFAFHGHKAMLRGRVGLDPSKGKTADLAALGKQVNARFDVKVPVALVREMALTMARQQADAASKAGKPAPDPVKAAQDMADAIIGKLLGNGLARLENDVLVSTIAFRGGVLRINGKKIELPQPKKLPAPAKPASAANFMQARRITDSCTLPDYPAEVIDKDAALELRLQFVVDPAGQLRDLKLAQTSGYPDYDAALLAAFAGCRFMPALNDGTPVEHTITQTLSREPGSARP